MIPQYRTYSWVSVFAISMGFFESAVVIYLRELYFPEGFSFPLKLMINKIALTEVIREAMSLLMIVSVAMLAARRFTLQFAFFIYIFALWDIFYYVLLKLILNWPDHFMTYDILFLIPANWVGPVLTPILVSLTMVLLAILLFYHSHKNPHTRIRPKEWMLLIAGAILIMIAFMYDYLSYIFRYYRLTDIFKGLDTKELTNVALAYTPDYFNWPLFILGETVLLLTIYLFHRRNRGSSKK